MGYHGAHRKPGRRHQGGLRLFTVRTDTYMCIHVHAYAYTYIHIHIHTYTYTYTYIYIHTCARARARVCVCVCVCVCVVCVDMCNMCICTCIHRLFTVPSGRPRQHAAQLGFPQRISKVPCFGDRPQKQILVVGCGEARPLHRKLPPGRSAWRLWPFACTAALRTTEREHHYATRRVARSLSMRAGRVRASCFGAR